jgi:WD40 repeat protein
MGHTGQVRDVAFSPDGSRVVTGSDDRTAMLWDTGTGYHVFALKGHPTMVYSVAFSPDGQRIATGVAGALAKIKVWFAPAP